MSLAVALDAALDAAPAGAGAEPMLTGADIICFAKDWTEDPTSNNHVMRLLARDNRVLWVNSIAMRTPDFTSGRDLGKIARKLRAFARGPRQVAAGLWVYTPVVLPFPHSRAAAAVNRHIARATIGLAARRLGMRRPQLWTFLPTAVRYLGTLNESLVVYYCTDHYAEFSASDTAGVLAMEAELTRRADLVFATAHSLVERLRRLNPETHLASHGVDRDHFAAALDAGLAPPADVAALPRPVLGFFGLIEDWIDQDLLAHVARARPDWSLVLIGNARVDTSRLGALPNVHLLGRRPYEQLPAYCRAFDLGLIPFAINELTRHVNPIKLREYLSAGLPVVATPLPELRPYREHCAVAETPEDFLAACRRLLQADRPAARRARSEAMRAETWERRVAALGEVVVAAASRKAAAAP